MTPVAAEKEVTANLGEPKNAQVQSGASLK